MSQSVARALISTMFLVLGGLLYIPLFLFAGSLRSTLYPFGGSDWADFVFAGTLVWTFVRISWYFLWRRHWVSTRARRRWDDLSALAMIGAGILVQVGLSPLHEREIVYLLATTIPVILQLMATLWIYRETPADRARKAEQAVEHRIACPSCGYNMTGLTSTRCPECGAQFTLDALLAAQQKSERTL